MEVKRYPDLKSNTYSLEVNKIFTLSTETLYKAWTVEIDHWFAVPGSFLSNGPMVNNTFFWETEMKSEDTKIVERYPHYGRFLQLIPNKLIEITWLTGPMGTKGAETIVKISMEQIKDQVQLTLNHSGFIDKLSKDKHNEAWPIVLNLLENIYKQKLSNVYITNTN